MCAADEFDLSAQRGESRRVLAVDGYASSANGVINPQPQRIDTLAAERVDVSRGFRLNDRRKAFGADVDFLNVNPRGLKLTIDYGKKGPKELSGAYELEISPKEVKITGYDETGAFYGLQTLRQLLQADCSTLPQVRILDWPEFKHRGVVEGFYGTPWSHLVRLSLIDFYGRQKLNTYIYGPKDDPYHSSPNWRLPYPPEQATKIRELVDASRRARVNFVWAIHPGKDIRWTPEDYDSLLTKLNGMYDLGVRDFALFFDDIEGIGTDPRRQAALVNDLTRDFVAVKGDVAPLMICPTDYSQMWANPGENGTLAVYGRELDPGAEVFWTGEVVCSDLTPETLEFVNSRIRRPALFWWNFPVTDYCRNYLLQGPVYGLDKGLTRNDLAGIVSNPMEHGEASKLALYGVADYAWNPKAYSPLDNWERGLREVLPEAAEAYRTFAIHNCDTETGYRRSESWETETFPFDSYTPEQFQALREEFQRVAAAPELVRQGGGNDLLLRELEPWLAECEKLGRRGLRTLDLIKTFEAGNDSAFWADYNRNLMTDDERRNYDAHKVATMKLQPFYENAMDDMYMAAYERSTGYVAPIFKGIGSYSSLGSIQAKLMTDGNDSTFYHSGAAQRPDDWIGLDLRAPRLISAVTILQGRNSIDDVDFFDHCIVESSLDGENWTPLTEPLRNQYEINWMAEAPQQARNVRLRRLDSQRRNWA
ncbi:MAG: beta-N-acetylglucosaminidase domain-containing protein, partial [Muribaculaceae bacterium]|nr:beta-N-acetylglucosaminidase domain-containing protein [Muribaculaceae bacterium]